MKTKILFLLFLTPALLWCQENIISNIVSAAKAGGEKFPFYNNMFQKENTKDFIDGTLFIDSTKVNVFSFDFNLDSLNISSLSLEIALADENVTLELLKVPDSFYDYEVVTDKGIRYSGHNSTGKHFRGIIKEDNNSLVAISFFENQIMGIIANDDGNYNIGNIENQNDKIIVYNEFNLKEIDDFRCEIEYLEPNQMSMIQENNKERENCVGLYFETEYVFFQNLGSVTAVENYVVSLFNQVALIYINESIPVELSEIMVWTSPDPYIGLNNSLALIYAFRDKIAVSSFNGDFAQLLINRPVGGRGYLDRLCYYQEKFRTSVTQATYNFPEFPLYSSAVKLSTHEFGHLFGSPHTHDCVWNGNNTAIDGCGTVTGCPDPGIPPVEERTIMSYCSNYPLSNGFGPQPGDLIRNRVNNAQCLGVCDDCPQVLIIDIPILSSGTYQAQYLVYATSEVTDDITVAYKAGQVILKPGFHVKGTAIGNFIASVDPCSE